MYIARKEGGRELVHIEDCVDAANEGHKEYTKKSKERIITAANNNKNKNNTRYILLRSG